MCYPSTTGLEHIQIRELTSRIEQVLTSRNTHAVRPAILSVARSVEVTLIVLLHNLTPALYGVSQPTISRIIRRFLPLIGQALCLHTPPLPQALRGTTRPTTPANTKAVLIDQF